MLLRHALGGTLFLALGCSPSTQPSEGGAPADTRASEVTTVAETDAPEDRTDASNALDGVDEPASEAGGFDAAEDVPVSSSEPTLDAALDARPLPDVARDVSNAEQSSIDSALSDVANEARADVTADAPADVSQDSSFGSTGCGRTGMPTGLRSGLVLSSRGVNRTYTLSIPSGYDPSRTYPLVFVFHGDGGTGMGIRGGFPIEAAAGTRAIFVYPDATPPARSWDLEAPLSSNVDLRFFADLLADVQAQYCVDRGRVFAAGHSRGGFFANILNCRLGTSVLRAVAPHSGSIYSTDPRGYTADGHVVCEGAAASALLVHGENDTTVPLMDGLYARDQWVWAQRCATATRAYAPSPCVEYTGCAVGKRVVWCAVPSIGHGVWSMAGAAAWNFFASF